VALIICGCSGDVKSTVASPQSNPTPVIASTGV
jgi:hypothetical protein